MGYRVAYIDCALDYLENSSVWEKLNDALRLRVRGYRKEYGMDVLPLSKDDFFSTQILIYKDDNLVCTYKFTRYDRCVRYRVRFPLLTALEEGNISEHSELIQDLLQNAKSKNHLIAYCGGWTIDPQLRMDADQTKIVRELVLATHYDYLTRFSIAESLICGVIKFKAHLMQEFVGYKKLQANGRELGSVGLAYLDFEPVYMLHLTEHSEEGRKLYEKYKSVLSAATIFSRTLEENEKKAA